MACMSKLVESVPWKHAYRETHTQACPHVHTNHAYAGARDVEVTAGRPSVLLLPSLPPPMRTIVGESDDECISVRHCSHQRQRQLSPRPIIDRRPNAVDG